MGPVSFRIVILVGSVLIVMYGTIYSLFTVLALLSVFVVRATILSSMGAALVL